MLDRTFEKQVGLGSSNQIWSLCKICLIQIQPLWPTTWWPRPMGIERGVKWVSRPKHSIGRVFIM
jgi:hypothetical protein